MKTAIVLAAALLALSAVPAASALGVPEVGPPDPGNPCRPQCLAVLPPSLPGPPDPGEPCRPQCLALAVPAVGPPDPGSSCRPQCLAVQPPSPEEVLGFQPDPGSSCRPNC